MERLAYLIKHYIPFLFPLIERLAALVTHLRYGKLFDTVLKGAEIRGSIGGRNALIRPLNEEDASALHAFLHSLSDEHIRFFRPHPFDQKSVNRILKSKSFLTYGMFLEAHLISYALLKASPTVSLYRGRIVHPDLCGKGIGRFVGEYLTWQSQQTGLRVRSTVSTQNLASRKSFGPSVSTRVIAQLPNDFELLEFHTETITKPTLNL